MYKKAYNFSFADSSDMNATLYLIYIPAWKPDSWKPDAWKPDSWKPDSWKPDAWKPDSWKPQPSILIFANPNSLKENFLFNLHPY